jgi:hypothetical protein
MSSHRRRLSVTTLKGIQPEGLFDDSELRLVNERLTELPKFRDTDAFIMDIPETIPQLGYGSHQFFRYYGKFPSILGREIVKGFATPGLPVLDCYAGSGTTLVEAQIAGYTSSGIDINPLGALACNVKTNYFGRAELDAAFAELLSRSLDPLTKPWRPAETKDSKLNKWFSEHAIDELGKIRAALNSLPVSPEREFLTVCFLAIIRRCSNAFDGEVRPHINQEKRPRNPVAALKDKYADMVAGLGELDSLRPQGVESVTVTGDNRDPDQYPRLSPMGAGLVVAHPPYLNSFNYLHAFSLEFMWAENLSEVWSTRTLAEIQQIESKAWPATNASILEKYYADLDAAVVAANANLAGGGVMAMVIGDATIRGHLEAVHLKAWDLMENAGLKPLQVWFRTTHYGIGKYAYSHRADYHGAAEKKDAILFFRK